MLDKLLRRHFLSCRLFYDLSIPIHDEKSGQSQHMKPLFQHVLRGYTFSCKRPLDIMQFVDGTVQALHDRHLIELFRHGILGMHIVGRILHLILETREIRFPGMNIYSRHDQQGQDQHQIQKRRFASACFHDFMHHGSPSR